jgi:MFS family permease
LLALLRRNRSLRALFFAQLVSYCGDWFAIVAVLGKLNNATDAAIIVSTFWVAQTLPSFLFTPLAGPVADRFDRRKVLITVSLCQAVAALGFLLVGEHTWVLAFVFQAAIASLASFVLPAAAAAVPNLVDEKDLKYASTLMSSTWGAMLAVGAALGGGFTVLFGREAAFIADAVSFLVAAALIWSIQKPMNAAGSASRGPMRPIADSAEALRVARRDPTLLALLMSKAGFGLGGGAVGLLAVIAERRYSGGDGATGLLLGARGAGALLGPIVAARLLRGSGDAARVLLLCGLAGFAFAAGYGLVAAAPILAIALVGVFIAHAGGGTQWTLSTYGLQAAAPDEFRGRILSADFALVTLTLSTSFVVAGALEHAFGATVAFVGLAVLAAAWSVFYLVAQQCLRRPA